MCVELFVYTLHYTLPEARGHLQKSLSKRLWCHSDAHMFNAQLPFESGHRVAGRGRLTGSLQLLFQKHGETLYLESHNPIFFQTAWPIFLVIAALIVCSHLCESCCGFLRSIFNKMSKKYGFATGRTAMFIWFDHFGLYGTGKTIFHQNNLALRLFPTTTG